LVLNYSQINETQQKYKINSPILYQPIFDFDNNHATFPFDPLTFGGFVLEASLKLPHNNACNGISITFTMCPINARATVA
jgi:hypothetical protein